MIDNLHDDESGYGRVPTHKVPQGHESAWLRPGQCLWIEGGPARRGILGTVEAVFGILLILATATAILIGWPHPF